MSQGKSVPRVNSGVPWWLWLLLVLITMGVVSGLLMTTVPQDPQQMVEAAIESAKAGNVEKVRVSLAELKPHSEFADHHKLLEGMLAVLEMRDPKAIELLEQAKENPDLRGLALSSVAQAYRRTGQLDKAVESLEAACDAEPDSVAPRLSLAGMYLNLGALTLAAREAETVLKDAPENAGGLRVSGNAYWEMHDYETAAERLREALKSPGQAVAAGPGEVERYLRALIKLKRTDELLEFADANVSLISDDNLRAEIMLRQGDDTGLRNMIDKMKEFGGGGDGPRIPKLKAQDAINHDETQKAHQLLLGQSAITPRDQEVWEMLRDTALKLDKPDVAAIAQQNIDGLEQLDKEYQTAAKETTGSLDDADAFVRLGDLALEVGDYELVYTWYQRAAVIDAALARAAAEKRQSMYSIQSPLVPLTPAEANGDSDVIDPDNGDPDKIDADGEASATDESDATKKPADNANPSGTDNEAATSVADEPPAPNDSNASSEPNAAEEQSRPDDTAGDDTAGDDADAAEDQGN